MDCFLRTNRRLRTFTAVHTSRYVYVLTYARVNLSAIKASRVHASFIQ